MAAVGSAVGLGNVWRFPYLTYKFGGGAFLVPYLIALFLIGIPMLMLEFAIGQKIQRGAVASFKALHPRFRGLGVFALLSAFIVVSYYVVVMAWSFLYFLASFGVRWAGDSEGFFFNEILKISESPADVGGLNLSLLGALLVVWIAIYFSVWKGVRSVGKVVWITVPLPIILLGILLVRGITLPGFLTGWAFYLKPDFNALLSTEVWMAAISQIFFTLSLAFGIMIAYASYKDTRADVAKDSYITSFVNSGISLFAGFVVFAVIGFMATQTGSPIEDVAAAGPGLAFVVFPEALSLMPFPAVFSVVFFLTLLTLGIDSAFSLVEAVNTAIADTDNKRKWKTYKVAFVVCLIGFLAGIIFTTGAGLYFLDIVDHFVTNYNLIIIGILQAVLVGWVYGADKLRLFMNEVSEVKTGKWWNFSIKYIIPIALIGLLLNQFWKEIRVPYEGYPAWALAVGWGVVAIPLLIFIVMFIKGGKEEKPTGDI